MRKLLILFSIITIPQIMVGQSFKEFNSQATFIEELKQQIVEKSLGDAKKVHKDMIDNFEEMWTELNSFTPSEKSKIRFD